MRLPALLALPLLLLFSVLLPRAEADTLLHFTSEAGDYIGAGQERTLSADTGYTFQASSYNTGNISFTVSSNASGNYTSYYLSFAAPQGTALAVGDYPGATRAGFQAANAPGLDFSGNGRGSNTSTGQFQILEITYDNSGKLATFAANFVQHSENAAPALYGQVRYNSSLPYRSPAGVGQLAANHYSVFAPAGTLSVGLTRRDGSTGPLAINYSTADGTDLAGRDYTATSGTVAWADGDTANKTITIPILNSGDPTQGNGTFTVHLSGAGTGAQTQAVVTVVNDNSAVTFVHFTSDAGDYIGAGQERTFSIANQYVLTPSRNYDGGVSFSFTNSAGVGFANSEYWNLDLASASGTLFGLGDYQDAERFPFQDAGHPGLSLSGAGRASNTLTGNFQVLEAQFDNDGNVLKFAANFEQHSEGGVPALYGQVRYNSTVAIPVSVGSAQFASASYSASENAGSVKVSVNRRGGSAGVLSVNYATADGTARAGVNYTATSGTLTWADGDGAPKTFTVPLLHDGVYSSSLIFGVNLSGDHVSAPTQTVVTVTNQDLNQPGTVQFSAAAYTVNDADGKAVITVNRVGGSNGAVSVKYFSTDGSAINGVNYTAVSGALAWADGDSAPRTFTVPLLNPVSGQASQSLSLSLSGVYVGAPGKTTLTINTTHFPPAGTLALSGVNYAANETDGFATITVNRTGGSFGALTVAYATADGTALAGRDYAATSGMLSWASGDGSPKLFTVPILNGQVGGGGLRALTIQLTGANLGTAAQGTLTITDNYAAPLPEVSVVASTPSIQQSSGGAGVFTISRTGDTSEALTVAFSVKGSAVNGQDYQLLKGSKKIKPGKASVVVKVRPVAGAVSGGKLTVKMTLLPQDGSYTVADDDKAKVKILP